MTLRVKLFGKNYFVEGSPYAKKTLANDYYGVIAKCANCCASTTLYVKKTVHINDIITGVKCSRCECRLEKQENK